MSEHYIGEIQIFAGTILPKGWAYCNGQLLSIAQNQALFSILGTTYGGDGITTFALPNLQGRVPMHWGNGPGLTPRQVGESSGSTTVTLTTTTMPAHTHVAIASIEPATTTTPGGNVVLAATATSFPIYHDTSGNRGFLGPETVGATGGSQPHNNMQPYLGLNFIIALSGIYPSRS